MTEIERQIVDYIRAHPACSSEQVYRALHGHADCPPCCRGYEKGPARDALPRLIDDGVVTVGRDWELHLRDAEA